MICELDVFDQDNEVGAFKIDISTDIPQYVHLERQNPNLIIG